jgi:hypothetical protein
MADAENASIYSERYVAFIDISGFSNIVRHSVGSPMQATELAAAFDRMHQRWSNPALQLTHDIANCDFRVQSFSDCTVMSTAATPAGLHDLLLSWMLTRWSETLRTFLGSLSIKRRIRISRLALHLLHGTFSRVLLYGMTMMVRFLWMSFRPFGLPRATSPSAS